jgi:hypothetical protein
MCLCICVYVHISVSVSFVCMSKCLCVFLYVGHYVWVTMFLKFPLSLSATDLIIEAKVNYRINTDSSLSEHGGDGQDVEG